MRPSFVQRAVVALIAASAIACTIAVREQPELLTSGRIIRAAAEPKAAPVEVGTIRWERDFPAALARARHENKPLLVVFTEVPGCMTCRSFGEDVLSHPLIAESAESLFVPVAIYNNVPGEDQRLLESFREPACNNPVVRVFDADRRELAPRLSGDYSIAGVARTMSAGLAASRTERPGYLQILAEEDAASRGDAERAAFAMHCFWDGEARLGAVPGVMSTSVGFLQGREVVEVKFDPTRLSYAQLLEQARALDCTSRIFTRTDEQQAIAGQRFGSAAVRTNELVQLSPTDFKKRLAGSEYRAVPMTPLQSQRLNASLSTGLPAEAILSPNQLRLAQTVRDNPAREWPDLAADPDFRAAWSAACSAARACGSDR